MQIKKRISSGGASQEDILRLEARLGSKLPGDYREFLAAQNGGRPTPSMFAFVEGGKQTNGKVQFFFTLDQKGKPYTVQENIAAYQGRVPSGLIPIACDSFGNLLLLDLTARKHGALYFWDHERENMDDSDEPTWENVYDVATSFKSFEDALE